MKEYINPNYFDILEGTVPLSQNLLFTDTHDLETMLLNSPALEKVLSEHGSETKINNFAKDIRQTLQVEPGASHVCKGLRRGEAFRQ